MLSGADCVAQTRQLRFPMLHSWTESMGLSSGIPPFLQMTANTAAVTLFSMSKAWKRSMSAHKVGPGMLGMAS